MMREIELCTLRSSVLHAIDGIIALLYKQIVRYIVTLIVEKKIHFGL